MFSLFFFVVVTVASLLMEKNQQKFVHRHLVVTRSYPIYRFPFVADDRSLNKEDKLTHSQSIRLPENRSSY